MLVSIITVCYNSEKFIKNAIDSVINQSYKNIEYIIIDGNSSDNTVSIIKSYGNQVTKFISEPDNGIYDAMNKGLKLATGEIVGILNSDDLYVDNTIISKIVSAFEEQNCNIIFGNLYFVDHFDIQKIVRVWKSKPFLLNSFKKGWHPPHPSFFVKNEIYKNYGYFNIKYKFAADFELMLRFLEKYKISNYYLDDFLVKMRMGGASTSGIKSAFIRNLEVLDSFNINNIHVSVFYPFLRLIPKIKQYLNK